MITHRMCCYCGVDPVDSYNRVYCAFCYHRFQKIARAYNRAGLERKPIERLHRTWNHWRQTPELDAMYLDPIERAA